MKRIAIVGTGVSGLVAAHLLSRRHHVEVFEADDRVGGHVHIVPVPLAGRVWPVDTGFIVYKERTYPLFTRLLGQLGVETRASEMSFSLRCERTGLEYNGGTLRGLFAQPGNLWNPVFFGMLRDIARFWRDARALLERPDPKLTLGDWLAAQRYGDAFVEQHLLPMGAAIWSTDAQTMRSFPAAMLLRFFANHGLLQLRDRPAWRVVRGGSARYVERLIEPFRERIHVGCGVQRIRRLARGVECRTADGATHGFDEIVLAMHSDQALQILEDASPAEREILGAIRYQPNLAVLHTDASFLPRARRAWASWNYHRPRDASKAVSLTYYMNRLQGFTAPEPISVTLNPSRPVRAERVLRRIVYAHPVFDLAASQAQQHRHRISGVRHTHYCGAYWHYGFHEDGVRSAVAVGEAFGESLDR